MTLLLTVILQCVSRFVPWKVKIKLISNNNINVKTNNLVYHAFNFAKTVIQVLIILKHLSEAD